MHAQPQCFCSGSRLKGLPFFWAHEVTNFDHAFFDKLFLIINGHADFAISATTIKLAFTAASLCDFAFVNIYSLL